MYLLSLIHKFIKFRGCLEAVSERTWCLRTYMDPVSTPPSFGELYLWKFGFGEIYFDINFSNLIWFWEMVIVYSLGLAAPLDCFPPSQFRGRFKGERVIVPICWPLCKQKKTYLGKVGQPMGIQKSAKVGSNVWTYFWKFWCLNVLYIDGSLSVPLSTVV